MGGRRAEAELILLELGRDPETFARRSVQDLAPPRPGSSRREECSGLASRGISRCGISDFLGERRQGQSSVSPAAPLILPWRRRATPSNLTLSAEEPTSAEGLIPQPWHDRGTPLRPASVTASMSRASVMAASERGRRSAVLPVVTPTPGTGTETGGISALLLLIRHAGNELGSSGTTRPPRLMGCVGGGIAASIQKEAHGEQSGKVKKQL